VSSKWSPTFSSSCQNYMHLSSLLLVPLVPWTSFSLIWLFPQSFAMLMWRLFRLFVRYICYVQRMFFLLNENLAFNAEVCCSLFFLILSFFIRKWEHLGDGSALRPTQCSLFGFLTLADESSQLGMWIWCSVVCNTPTRRVYGSMTQQGFQDFAYKNSVIEDFFFLPEKVALIIIWLLTL